MDAVKGLFEFDDDAAADGSAAAAVPADPLDGITLVVSTASSAAVRAQDKVRYNTNNHFDCRVDAADATRLVAGQPPVPPADYAAAAAQCRTSRWADLFHAHYRVVNVARAHLPSMRAASRLALAKAGVSPLYAGDIADAAAATDAGGAFDRCDAADAGSGYFVRTEEVSLKAGVHGAGPYHSMRAVLESAVTAYGGHQGVNERSTQLKYFLFPWRTDLDTAREFRVFVHRGRVTAVSQQNLYDANPVLAAMDTDAQRRQVVRNWCGRLLPYIAGVVIPRIAEGGADGGARAPPADGAIPAAAHAIDRGGSLTSFVLDIVLLGPPRGAGAAGSPDLHRPELLTPYFIEVNPFGFAYSSGSSLFSWVHDFALLYGLSGSDAVHVRYTTAGGDDDDAPQF
jgi:hypothetical protein